MAIWVIVADSSRARILSAASVTAPLIELEDFVHNESRLPAQALVTDRTSQRKDFGGHGRHTMGHEKTANIQEAKDFARELCAEIDNKAQKGDFHRLYIIAPPKFLGTLRSIISKTALERVAGEISKNLVRHNIEDIRSHLPQKL